MTGGYAGRIGFIDLTTGKTREERLDEKLARSFIGGYGLGSRIIIERQKAGCDPLGQENILGFITGPLTGTPVPTGGRFTVVCKSPLTGGTGDANSGGYFGSSLKSAGWDAIFVSGIAPVPTYAVVSQDGIELRDASHVWGKDTADTDDILKQEIGFPKAEVACIGPASEKLSLISGIVTDKGRIAARSGVGAVMGAKRLKALVAYGDRKATIADEPNANSRSRPALPRQKAKPSDRTVPPSTSVPVAPPAAAPSQKSCLRPQGTTSRCQSAERQLPW